MTFPGKVALPVPHQLAGRPHVPTQCPQSDAAGGHSLSAQRLTFALPEDSASVDRAGIGRMDELVTWCNPMRKLKPCTSIYYNKYNS